MRGSGIEDFAARPAFAGETNVRLRKRRRDRSPVVTSRQSAVARDIGPTRPFQPCVDFRSSDAERGALLFGVFPKLSHVLGRIVGPESRRRARQVSCGGKRGITGGRTRVVAGGKLVRPTVGEEQ